MGEEGKGYWASFGGGSDRNSKLKEMERIEGLSEPSVFGVGDKD
jgi:hypothetical protein